MLDKDKILDSCNAEEIANLIGMETFKKGKNTYILCPGHYKRLGKYDTKPTNAVLTERGYHCFACGKSVNTIDMVSEVTGMPFYEALKYVASLIGGEEYYQQNNTRKSMNTPLSNQEYELIGIETKAFKEIKIVHTSEYKDEKTTSVTKDEYDKDGKLTIYSYDPSVSFSIRELFFDDYPFYCLIIRNCCENQIRKIYRLIKKCRNPEFLFSIGIRTKEMQDLMIIQYKKMIKDIYIIYQTYCKKLREPVKPIKTIIEA